MHNNNKVAINYLRAFITILVVAHHSFLAYANIIRAPATSFVHEPNIWTGFPVVDKGHWIGFDLILLFNDTFFMSLMFFISGLFVWQSIARKGPADYLRGRFLRLGLPFVLVSAFLIPLAYYPAYLSTGSNARFVEYIRQWLLLNFWPSGPCWFIGALLVFDILAVLLFRFSPNGMNALGTLCQKARQQPGIFFLALLAVSIAVTLPMLAAFGPFRWMKFGPFAIQAGRLLLYPVWFFAGMAIGAAGAGQGLLSPDGKLVRRWAMWAGIAAGVFIIRVVLMIMLIKAGSIAPSPLLWLSALAFVLSCCAISFFLLAVFLKFANRPNHILENISANAYGIYLVHYAFAIWIQYAFLSIALPAAAKGMIVFILAFACSWAATAGIRSIPAVDRVLSGGRGR